MKLTALFLALVLIILSGCGVSTETTGGLVSFEGPSGREVSTVYADPSHPGVVFAGLTTGEIYRSDDMCGHWNLIGTTSPDVPVIAFQAPADTPKTLLALTLAGIYQAQPGYRLWTRIQSLPIGDTIGVLTYAVDQWNPSIRYLGTLQHGLYKTSDGGSTWTSLSNSQYDFSATRVVALVIDHVHPNHLYAAVNGFGVMTSPDAGLTWQRLTPEFSPSGSQVTTLALEPNGTGEITYGTETGTIARSTDGGTTWKVVRKPKDAGRIFSIASSPANGRTLLAGTESGLIISEDFGDHWSDCTGTLPHLTMFGLFSPDGTTIFAYGDATGVLRSGNQGMTWERADADLGGSTVTALASNLTGEKVYAAIGGAIVSRDRNSKEWELSGPGLPGDRITGITVEHNKPSSAFVSTSFGAYRTANGGRSWGVLSPSLPLTPALLEIHPHVPMRFFASGVPGMFASTDKGYTWAHTKPVTERYDIRSFTFMEANAAIAYAATAGDGILISTNGGIAWQRSRYGLPETGFRQITLDRTDQQTAYAWTDAGAAYRTVNQGLEWSPWGVQWRSGDSVTIIADRFTPSSVIAVVQGSKLFRSADGGGSWTAAGTVSIPGEAIAWLWNDASSRLYVAVRHRGVYVVQPGPAAQSSPTTSSR
jgi:photosystem II stability/assembly factor-like uncharacterized protein